MTVLSGASAGRGDDLGCSAPRLLGTVGRGDYLEQSVTAIGASASAECPDPVGPTRSGGNRGLYRAFEAYFFSVYLALDEHADRPKLAR